jgi:hypothetical protein
MIQKSKIKQFINAQGLRISPDAFDGIQRNLENVIKDMCKKVTDDGMKTLMVQHTGITKQSGSSPDSIYGRKCQRCSTLDDAFLRKGQDEQRWFYDEVKRCADAFTKRRKYDPHFATRNGRVNNFMPK